MLRPNITCFSDVLEAEHSARSKQILIAHTAQADTLPLGFLFQMLAHLGHREILIKMTETRY